MPAPVDHDARRADLTAAVWRVLVREGFVGLSLRAVAAEMGATTGLVTHYFPGKDALVRHALDVLHDHTDRRIPDPVQSGLPGLRQRLLSVVPLDEELVDLSRIWVSFWDLALADPDLAAREAARYDRWRGSLRPLVLEALARGELRPADAEVVLDIVTAATHGLVVQALFDPRRFPPAVLRARVDQLVDLVSEGGLEPPRPNTGTSTSS